MLRKLGPALVPFAVLGLVELGVRTLGAADSAPDLSRGFDAGARYLLPDPDAPGGFRTRMFDGKKEELTIPPRDERTRVLLFGGSNTESFPHNPLRWVLKQKNPGTSPEIEVVKLGRNGYGSQRVSILFEQSMALEPDVCLVYSGHNEFIEAGFRDVVEEAWSPSGTGATAALRRLRTFEAMVGWFEGQEVERDAADVAPEEWTWEYDRFRDYTYDRTVAHLEGYRANLTRMCEVAAEHGVDLVLCTVAGNMLAAPFSSRPPEDTEPADADEIVGLVREAWTRMPERYRLLVPSRDVPRLHVKDWAWPGRAPRVDAEPPPTLRALGGMYARRPDWWPAPPEWSDRVRPFLEPLEDYHARVLDDGERAGLEEGLGLLERALELCPDHPLALFERGAIELLLGRADEARESLLLAGRYDRAPRRASDLTNDIVREVAAAHPEVRLFDVEAELVQHTPDGILGYELMKDECHIHGEALKILMWSFADVLVEVSEARRGR